MADGSLLLGVCLSVDGEWINDGIRLAGRMSLSSRIHVRNRHKFGDENLMRFEITQNRIGLGRSLNRDHMWR
ncbi:hypothetical protein DY000_02005713 [Brassica cretica]|uniref:Uncharacterized protein n=1 Tax=Brassica cretica TaxID=69181 RepID=A0ABQ7C7S6_BRACR|nr:hypothetical protein DY000_02005713 [Brassica cretica]